MKIEIVVGRDLDHSPMRSSFVVFDRQIHSRVRHPTTDSVMGHDRRSWLKRLVVWTAACGSLSVALASQQIRAEPKPPKRAWREYSFDLLGIRLSYPDSCEAWIKGGELFIRVKSTSSAETQKAPLLEPKTDRAVNGRILSQDGQYLLHLSLGSGDFRLANTRHRIFEKSNDGMRVAFGRFENPRADRLERNGWKGYASTIVCSTFDEETGFHAAGGLCYWGLVSNNSRYVVLDSTVLSPQEEQIVQGIVKSLRFIKQKI